MPVGKYRIEVSAQGFQTLLVSNVVLDVDQQREVNITLQIGSIEQHIAVSATAVAMETSSTQLGNVIEERKLLQMPLNGRSYIDLLALQPGVVPVTTVNAGQSVSGKLSSGNLSANGQRETANAFLVNGGDVNESMNLGTSIIPNLDSVAKFRLVTNSFDAEYGKLSGSVMNAITKSGTNSFHDTAFEFLRNVDLDARNFFAVERASLKCNQFGYAVGGPFIRNKVLWVTDYQGTREI